MFAARAGGHHQCLPVRNKSGHTGYREMPAADHAGTHGHCQVFVHGLLQLFAGCFSFFIMEHVFWSP
tara:strand:+ start:408 stop:608 length:201 start_codon:yes stop_codon:yes gene_type:complete